MELLILLLDQHVSILVHCFIEGLTAAGAFCALLPLPAEVRGFLFYVLRGEPSSMIPNKREKVGVQVSVPWECLSQAGEPSSPRFPASLT